MDIVFEVAEKILIKEERIMIFANFALVQLPLKGGKGGRVGSDNVFCTEKNELHKRPPFLCPLFLAAIAAQDMAMSVRSFVHLFVRSFYTLKRLK